jgi:hypothetical protein
MSCDIVVTPSGPGVDHSDISAQPTIGGSTGTVGMTTDLGGRGFLVSVEPSVEAWHTPLEPISPPEIKQQAGALLPPPFIQASYTSISHVALAIAGDPTVPSATAAENSAAGARRGQCGRNVVITGRLSLMG